MDGKQEVTYNNGDVVWVKLGMRWWPGEVTEKDKLEPEIANLKKPPLVIVKFFDEDNYEFVKNWNTIYPYNSEKKNDFIKKGMAGFRSKAAHMEKFPKDVLKAETLVGGNPDILSDPMFLPEKKVNYVAEIFGSTSTPKGKAKDKKPRPSKSQEDTSYITHRRFLGQDDYKAVYLIQYPGKDRNEEDNDEIIRLNRQPEEKITCNNCSFSTTRMDVMVLHTKSHVRRGKHMITLKKKHKKKRPKAKNAISDDESSDVPKKKKKKGAREPRPKAAKQHEGQGTSKGDLRTDLLAEWGDSSGESDEDVDKSGDKEETFDTTAASSSADNTFNTEMESSTADASKSDDKTASPANVEVEEEEEADKVEEKEADKVEEKEADKVEEKEADKVEEKEADKVEEKDEAPVVEADKAEPSINENDAKAATPIKEPEEPIESKDADVDATPTNQASKSCFDFDEDEEDHPIIPTASTGRKIPRVIPLTERRKTDELEDDKTEATTKSTEDINEAFQELMDMTAVPELPDIQNALKCEQNFHSVPTIKFPDKSENDRGSPAEKQESNETATKLTNPKKRFVKSFEDFEKEVRRKEELEDLAKKQERGNEDGGGETIENEEDAGSSSPVKDVTTLARLKSKIMSKIMDESNKEKPTASSPTRSRRQSSKSKKAKQKVSDDSSGDEKESSRTNRKVDDLLRHHPTKIKNAHKTHRSKILETYRNEQEKITDDPESREPPDESPPLQENSEEPKREVLPPKKSKWSRRVSHSKKDRILSMSTKNSAPHSEEEGSSKSDIQMEVQPSDFQKEITESILDKPFTHEILVETAPTTETVAIESTDEQMSYEQYNVDTFSLSNKEEFSPVEKASVFLPEDAICSPPRQSKKRKSIDNLSEEEELDFTTETKPLVKHRKVSTETKDPKPESDTTKPAEDTSITPQEQNEPIELPSEPVNLPSEPVDLPSAVSQEYDDVSTERVPPTIENIFEDKEDNLSNDLFDVDRSEPTTDGDLVIEEQNVAEEIVCSQEDVVMEEIIDVGFEEKFYENKGFKTDGECFDHVKVDGKGLERTETEVTLENQDSNAVEVKESESVLIETPGITNVSQEVDELQPECLEVCEEVVYDDKHVQDQFEAQEYAEEKLRHKEDDANPDDFVDQSNIELEYPVSDNFNVINQQEEVTPVKDTPNTLSKEPLPGELVLYPEPELVPIEGNLTVVSEKDLADGQVEITSEQVINSKKNMLSNFSMDFSDSTNDSTGDMLHELSETKKDVDKAKLGVKKGNTYDQFELLDILEGNPKPEKKVPEQSPIVKSIVDDFCDFEDHIPSQIVCAKKLKQDKEDADKLREEALRLEAKKLKGKQKSTIQSTTSKLLQRLTDGGKKSDGDKGVKEQKGKSVSKGKTVLKPVVLVDQGFKAEFKKVMTNEKLLNDVEDVKTFVIKKDVKKSKPDEFPAHDAKSKMGKAKILQQTIIKPAGEIIQPETAIIQTDDNIFDINSMPIVLSDQILTPESIENIPIVISGKTISQEKPPPQTDKKAPPRKFITKISTTTPPALVSQTPSRTIVSPAAVSKLSKPAPRILQMGTSKAIRQTVPVPASTSSAGKYILVPQSADLSPKGRKVSGKSVVQPSSTEVVSKTSAASGLVGNKVMILTNEQGEQKRVLLTPEHQKMLGYQSPKTKLTKGVVKGNIVTKGVGVKSPSLNAQKIIFSTTSTSVSSNQPLIGTPLSVNRMIKSGVTKKVVQSPLQKSPVNIKNQKSIVIKNQVIRKVGGSEDDLEKQVAEQLEAIRASSGMKVAPPKLEVVKTVMKTPPKRSYPKKAETKVKGAIESPPSSMKSPKKPESSPKTHVQTVVEPPKAPSERPLNQLVIQDAVGTQTTITEGQIIALPSETAVDGQPHSYMLVTLDEHGNLTPLNNEALMSLDPNLGGDLNNVVLQIEPSAITSNAIQQPVAQPAAAAKTKIREPEIVKSAPSTSVEVVRVKKDPMPPVQGAAARSPVSNANGEPTSQQFIISGDPIATQKFLESLSVGNTDLANILANADGNSILIQADGQQILINTNSSDSILSVNNNNPNNEASESAGNPVFATQPSKNQDILAAALADTDVLQQEQHASQKLSSQLSPNNALYPMNVGNVLETSLMLSSPIMTPLEVPSSNSKKIPDDEADILTQVPKNVDLPITITDPNISQTVANQQVPPFSTDLPTNLELSLPIVESSIASTKGMNSPSFNSYSLPNLDDGGMSDKTFGNSMPLLTEDVVEDLPMPTKEVEVIDQKYMSKSDDDDNSFLDDDDDDDDRGGFPLGRQICSSLSEPPPEVFDLSEMNQQYMNNKRKLMMQAASDASDNTSKDTDLSTLAESSNDGSLEIPLQAPIVARSQNLDAFTSD